MTRQELFIVWILVQVTFWAFLLGLPNLPKHVWHGLAFGMAILGNVFYIISQRLRDENVP